jgi:putative tricarboxylic transport membrane protein
LRSAIEMIKADRISGVFWLAFAVLVSIEAYRLGLGTLHHPGPGFLFFWTSIVLGLMSLFILISAGRSKKSEETHILNVKKLGNKKIILVVTSLFIYALLMEYLGFIPVTLLFIIFLLGIVEKKGWFFTISTSVVATALAYLLFETWLKSQLPKGLLESLRF